MSFTRRRYLQGDFIHDAKKSRKAGKPLHVWRYHKKVAEEVGALRKKWKSGEWSFDWYDAEKHRMMTVEILRIKPYTPWVRIRLESGEIKSVRYTTLYVRQT